MVVLLPAPFGPSSASPSPRRMSRSTPRRTSLSPYRIRSPRTLMASGAGAGDDLTSEASAGVGATMRPSLGVGLARALLPAEYGSPSAHARFGGLPLLPTC